MTSTTRSSRLGHRAAELLRVAAERALDRDDLASAGSLAERALERLDDADDAVPDLLLVACESLLGLGDVTRGRPRVEHLVAIAVGDDRLSAWADCFVAQLAVLTEPGRLYEVERTVDAAARRLAALGDEAGVAKARLVRAGALARLGRVGDCEAELDIALTAARSAGERRRVAVVLGAAPVAALWGPSPIPRAGGRCLDVIRLLRITTGSPAVEATSVRCQAVLEALRGRFDTARSMLADARATVEELGLRNALGETDLYAGIVELLADDPVAAEGPLRAAYQRLGRLGIGADAGQAAAYLARALLLQGRLDEADDLAADSHSLAGQNPQTVIAARATQAEILAARGNARRGRGAGGGGGRARLGHRHRRRPRERERRCSPASPGSPATSSWPTVRRLPPRICTSRRRRPSPWASRQRGRPTSNRCPAFPQYSTMLIPTMHPTEPGRCGPVQRSWPMRRRRHSLVAISTGPHCSRWTSSSTIAAAWPGVLTRVGTQLRPPGSTIRSCRASSSSRARCWRCAGMISCSSGTPRGRRAPTGHRR